MAGETERIVVSDDGLSLPVIEVLTGRGAIFGKSGSGKSNTASVVVEELLEKGFPVLIVDIEGEYATLTERYDIVHVGDGDSYDHQLFETDPGQIVDFCLDQHRPVIIDVSEVLELERAERVITDTLQVLFSREKRENKPFLVIVEEVHEFLPQQGGLDDLGEMLIRIAKRGRKRGLGLLGMSQRPASVDKNFITQCDWLVFHRLTWENDTRVVKTILGKEYADDVKDLGTGAAFLLADWEEAVRQVRFRAKKTADAGDTPSLSASERRDLTSRGEGRDPADGFGGKTGSERTSETADPNGSTASGAEGDEEDNATEGSEENAQTETSVVVDQPDETDVSHSGDSDADSDSGQETQTESTDRTEELPAPESPPGSGPARAVWELGHFVSYFLIRVFGAVSYRMRVFIALVRGEPKPVDRLGAVSVEEADRQQAPTRFAIRIFLILLVLIVALVVVAFLSA